MLQGVSSGLERMPENMCVNSSSSRRSVSTVRDGLAPKTAPGVGKIALLLEQRDDRTRAPTAENGSPQRNWKSQKPLWDWVWWLLWAIDDFGYAL